MQETIINLFTTYKFLTISQLSRLLHATPSNIDVIVQALLSDGIIANLHNEGFESDKEVIYFIVPDSEEEQTITLDMDNLSISEHDHFRITNSVNFHLGFDEFTNEESIKIDYFSAYFDNFNNRSKGDHELSGKFTLNSGEYLLPDATMRFVSNDGRSHIYALELFTDAQIDTIIDRLTKYYTVLEQSRYKLDKVLFLFEDKATKELGIQTIIDADILQDHKNSFLFKTVESMDKEFGSNWQLFYSTQMIDFVSDSPHEVNVLEKKVDEEVPAAKKKIINDQSIQKKPDEAPTLQEEKPMEHPKTTVKDDNSVEQATTNPQTPLDESIAVIQEVPKQPSIKERIHHFFSNHLFDDIVNMSKYFAIIIYLFAGIAAFIVSAYMEMIAFDSFYPDFFLVSVVMVIAFEVAKVGTIFVRTYIQHTKTELSKVWLKILNALFIPLLFGLSIISSIAVTADKLESPHAEELKVQAIKNIEQEYAKIIKSTEDDHVRRVEQLKKDFFEKIKNFEDRKEEVLAEKDRQIEHQKTIYGKDGRTWKGSKYQEHVHERMVLVNTFARERMALEKLYNAQIQQEAKLYRNYQREDLKLKNERLQEAESEVLATSWQAQNEMVRSFIKVVNHGFGIQLTELDFIFFLSILVSILLELTIYKVFSNIAIAYTLNYTKRKVY